MGSIPDSEADWRDRVRAGQVAFGRAMVASADGAELYDRDGVVGQVFPEARERSVFNSVFYEDAEGLSEALDELDRTYREAGVLAWTVWVPEGDTGAAEALEAAGHRLDATPRDMAMDLADLAEPAPDPGLAAREEYDLATMARINEVAYGYPPGGFAAVEAARMSDFRTYFADLDGEPVSTLAIWAHGEDAVVAWVATLPEARGRGLSTRLLGRALADAREQGLRTTTLQSTKLGYPVYAKLGYRDLGSMQMWERRDRKAAALRNEGRIARSDSWGAAADGPAWWRSRDILRSHG